MCSAAVVRSRGPQFLFRVRGRVHPSIDDGGPVHDRDRGLLHHLLPPVDNRGLLDGWDEAVGPVPGWNRGPIQGQLHRNGGGGVKGGII